MTHFQYTCFHMNDFASLSSFHLKQPNMPSDSRLKALSMLQILLMPCSLIFFPLLTYWESSIKSCIAIFKRKIIKYSDWWLSWRKRTSLSCHFEHNSEQWFSALLKVHNNNNRWFQGVFFRTLTLGKLQSYLNIFFLNSSTKNTLKTAENMHWSSVFDLISSKKWNKWFSRSVSVWSIAACWPNTNAQLIVRTVLFIRYCREVHGPSFEKEFNCLCHKWNEILKKYVVGPFILPHLLNYLIDDMGTFCDLMSSFLLKLIMISRIIYLKSVLFSEKNQKLFYIFSLFILS